MFQHDKKNTACQSLEDIYLKMTVGDTVELPSDLNDPQDAFLLPSALEPTKETLEVVIEDDGMIAMLRSHSKKPLPVLAKDILKLMATYGIVSGIDYEAVDRAALTLNRTGVLPADFIVARGVQPAHADVLVFPELEKQINPKTGIIQWFGDGRLLDFKALATVMTAKQLNDIAAGSCVAMAVYPFYLLATLTRHPDHNPGCNVYGLSSSSPDVFLKAGSNIEFNPADGSYKATIYGYLHIEENIISVLPPVWIAPDQMSAYFVNLPQIGAVKAPTVDQLRNVLITEGIYNICIKDEALQELCEGMERHEAIPSTVLIASGFPPSPGTDAKFVCLFDTAPRAGTVQKDDSVDLRDRNLVVSVETGTLIAEKHLPTKGTSGATLFGKIIKTTDGVDNIRITTNENIRRETMEGLIRYYAKTNGNILFKDGLLAIIGVFRLPGDVDYSTGNIDVTTDLLVEGSVNPGFTVKAAGAVRIKGTIEPGATVIAKGGLVVEKGIIGDTTRVITLGNLQASYIHDAEVIAKGDITVQSYTANARIRCGGTVTVLRQSGSRQGGKIMGGRTYASKGIHACTVGTLANQDTVVALQNTPEELLALSKLGKEIDACAEHILKMTRTMQLSSLAPEKIQAIMAALPPERKEFFKKALVALNQIIKQREALQQEERQMKERMECELGKATIQVTSAFIQGNIVQIGDRKLIVPEDTGPVVFQLKDGVITY